MPPKCPYLSRRTVFAPVRAAATAAPTQQATTALTTNYTAGDIVRHMQAVDNTVFIGTTGETIWTFSHNNYYTGVHATSSVQFTGCPIGGCADVSHYGLWVYANPQDAATAYVQVNTDSQSCTDSSPASDGMYVVCGIPEQEYVHGRCLLLNSVDTSVYGQVVTKYCV